MVKGIELVAIATKNGGLILNMMKYRHLENCHRHNVLHNLPQDCVAGIKINKNNRSEWISPGKPRCLRSEFMRLLCDLCQSVNLTTMIFAHVLAVFQTLIQGRAVAITP